MFDPLLLPIGIPLLAGLLCLLLPPRWSRVRGWMSVFAAGLTLASIAPLLGDGARMSETGGWLFLRVDALSWFILLAAGVLAILIAMYSLYYMQGKPRQSLYYTCFLWSLSFSCGVLLANDLILLLICWGLLAVTLYAMVGLAGADAAEAARKTLVIVGGSDALLLLGTVLFWLLQGSTRMDVAALNLNSTATCTAFLCFAAAAFAKAGVIPLHSWLPDCGEKADAPVVAFLPASLDKLLGIYLLARAAGGLFQMNDGMNTVLMVFGAVTVIGAVMMALVQNNLKRLMAFCAVSQVGYMVMGIASGTLIGLAGALFHMLNHAVYKSCLFLVAGVVEKKTGSVDLDRLGGLATRLPVTFFCCLIAALSISGIPPLNGFASKWMVYQGLIESGGQTGNLLWVVWLGAAMLGSVLTLACFVKVLHAVFLCKPAPQVRSTVIRRVAWTAAVPMITLASLCLVFGVFAYAIPLQLLIEPAIGEQVTYQGAWAATTVSGLLLACIGLGWLVYALTMGKGKFRRCPTYIGGENMEETSLLRAPVGPERHVEVTGVDFFATVEHLPGLKSLYRLARKKRFDIYELCAGGVAWVANLLRRAHTGVLTLYVVWFVLGLLAILYVMTKGLP